MAWILAYRNQLEAFSTKVREYKELIRSEKEVIVCQHEEGLRSVAKYHVIDSTGQYCFVYI